MTFKRQAARKEFKKLTYPHMKLLYNVALKYCGNVFDAEDVLQETYLLAFNKFDHLREKSKCKPWLLRILRNNFLKSYHKKKNRQRLSDTDYIDFLKNSISAETAENILENASGKQIVQQAIEQLPPKYKEILILYYMEDLLYKDIAALLQIPIGTVMSRLTRARERLKTILIKTLNSKKDKEIFNISIKKSGIKKFRVCMGGFNLC
jgi:RNA polymerase sigma factor (sigma-70 family)